MIAGDAWSGVDGALGRRVEEDNHRNRDSYGALPERIASDFRSEQEVYEGDYRRRQIFELIQNGADAIGEGASTGGRVHVLLTESGLYCANEGAPFTADGINSLRFQLWSAKSGNEIGRFGRGFKSVLALTDTPWIYSRSGSFVFSREATREFLLRDRRISTEHVGGARVDVPILAIAVPVDPEEARRKDELLADLMSWATTVIHVPFSSGTRFQSFTTEARYALVANDLDNFDSAFLIFAKHVRKLDLEIRGPKASRRSLGSRVAAIASRPDLPGVTIFDASVAADEDDGSKWTLLEATPLDVPPSVEGLSINRRKDDEGNMLPVPLSWAIPASAAQLGSFWSFFPTREHTSLRGILNAPWDTNTERTRLLENSYNRHLIEHFSALVVQAAPLLQSLHADDPGAYLEYMPARGREENSPAAGWLASAVNSLASKHQTLPDVDGVMRVPATLMRPPEAVPVDVQEAWSQVPGAPRNFVHPSAADPDRTVRTARVRLYMEGAHSTAPESMESWLELLMQSPTPEASIRALGIARHLDEASMLNRERIEGARIVMLADGTLSAPDRDRVYLPVGDGTGSDIPVVHPSVVADPRALQTLRETFGLRELDDAARLEQLVADWPEQPIAHDWAQLWTVVETIGVEPATDVLQRLFGTRPLHVRMLDGSWRPLTDVLLVGEIIGPDHLDDAVTVDDEFHARSMQVLWRLGVSDTPADRGGTGTWLDEYREEVRAGLRAHDLDSARVKGALVTLPDVPTHLHVLPELSPRSAARLCGWAARLPGALNAWRSAQLDIDLESPTRWHLRRRGVFLTSTGPEPFANALTPELSEFERVFPVVQLPQAVAEDLLFCDDPRLLPIDVLRDALARLRDEVDDLVIGRVLSAACTSVETPTAIRCRHGRSLELLPPSQVVAIADAELFKEVCRTGTPALLVPTEDDAMQLVEQWGLRSRSGIEESFEYDPTDEPALLNDEYFLLGEMFGDRTSGVRFQHCTSVRRVVRSPDGRTESEVPFALDANLLLVRSDGSLSDDVLRAASSALGLDLSDEDVSAILENRRSAEIEALMANVRSQPDDESRVRVLFSLEVLRKLLPKALIDEVGAAVDDHSTCAGLALAVHGTQLLAEARADLESMGLRPPSAWAGSPAALRFVRDLGFDAAFAGFPRANRDAELRVPGPVELKLLHDYQAQLASQIQDLIRHPGPSTGGGWRALLYLPTGAGKTRVAVQAVLEMVEAGELYRRTVVWIAQTDELCEQAVSAFREVWGALGNSGDLLIGRLWAGNHVSSPEEAQEDWRALIVVATISKLTAAVVETERYEWLRHAAVVFADEAHLADSPEYTQALRWFGTGVRQRGDDRRPLIGLTATPFKSGEVATTRLRNRFGGRLLQISRPPDVPEDGWTMSGYLRDLGVLARAKHEVLAGVDVALDDDELSELTGTDDSRKVAWLPAAVEGRIAVNSERNLTLLRSIESLPDDWPVIVFAISVVHAQLLAAQLKLRGIEAASVSASTHSGARHHYIRQFRAGAIRVITNYGVLTTGFDAPETRAIYVARPTFSESLYVQMIGRGLRGPLNGGKPECLIVDIKDNIERFGGTLAFDDVGHLWKEDGGDSMSQDEWAQTAADVNDDE